MFDSLISYEYTEITNKLSNSLRFRKGVDRSYRILNESTRYFEKIPTYLKNFVLTFHSSNYDYPIFENFDVIRFKKEFRERHL